MSTNIEHKTNSDSSNAKPPSATADPLSSPRLNAKRLGLGFGATGVVFYLGCMITMATAPRDKAVIFFNSLLHGFNVEPILQTRVPAGEVVLGLITTFILGWFAGALIAGFYNLGLRTPGKEQRNMTMNESKSVTKDPICGMTVDQVTAIHAERDGKTFYFCSDHCRQKFLSTPAGAKPEDKSGGCCG